MTVPPSEAPLRESPSSIGTIIMTLIVLLAAGTVVYFAFFGPAAARQTDSITITTPATPGTRQLRSPGSTDAAVPPAAQSTGTVGSTPAPAR